MSRGSVLSWLLGVARNGSRKLLVNKNNSDALEDLPDFATTDDAHFVDELTRAELIDSVRYVISTLPAMLREVVILCELQELEYQEAAKVLRCPIGTVRSRLNRARALLASKLRTRCPA
jgi:RNA polymerase sigma-70 factor (ECF subfamily)